MRGMERSAGRAGGGQEEAMFTALIRTVILYILIIAGVRLMGKRQVGSWSLGAGALPAHRGPGLGAHAGPGHPPPCRGGAILALLSLTMILSVLTMKSIRFRT